MAKEAGKQGKAVEKIRKAIRKAVEKGVSAKLVSATVEDALSRVGEEAGEEKAPANMVSAKTVRVHGRNKQTDVTMKRGVIGSLQAASKPGVKSTTPMGPDSEKAALSKLPGKRKPPTLTLRRGQTSKASKSTAGVR